MKVIFSQITMSILAVAIYTGCGSSLKIRDFSEYQQTDNMTLLTSQISYERNSVISEELVPPLIQEWEEEYISLPNQGFTGVNNWLFFTTYNGYLAAIDIEDGDLRGKKNLGDASASPPTIHNNILYITFESGSSGLIAYDISRGRIIWEIEENFSRSSPIVTNDMVLFQTMKGEIFGLNYLNGKEIWKRSTQTDIRNSPALKNNTLVTVTQNGEVYALESSSGVILWRKELDQPIFASPVIENNRIYITTHSGNLFILNLNSGATINQKNIGVELYNSPTIDIDNIYIALSNGMLLALDKNTLFEKWRFLGEGPIAGAALASSTYLYLSTLGQYFYILEKKNGQLLQKIELSGRARSSPVIKQGKIMIACEDKLVIAYVEDN